MYNVSDELKNILNTNSAIISTARLTFSDPQLVIDGDNLYSLKIKDYCYNEGRIIGTNIARDAEVEIKNDNYNLQDKEFYLEIGIQLSDGTYEYIPYGYFIVDSIENIKSNNKIKLKAMDRMIKLNDDFVEFNANLYPMTMKQFLNKFAEQYGIELVNQTLPNENFVIKTIPYFTGSTGRQVVKQMAEVFGKFAKFDRTGKLGFYLKNNTNEQITRDKMNSKLEVNDLYGEVNVVTISLYTDVEGENITRRDEQSIAQYGENIIEISENAFLNTQEERERAIDGIFNAIKGFKYIPTNFQYMGRPYLDCGDTIKVQDMETDNFYDSIVLNNYISVPGLRKSTLENKALTKTEVELQYTGEVKSVQKHTELIVDKVNQNIKFVVEKQEEQSQTITYIDNKVDNLKIGATNLLKGTQDFSGATLNKGTILEEKYNNLSVSCYELNSPVGSGKYLDVIRWDNSVNVEPNTEYTLSYYIKGTLDNSNSYFFPSNVESGYGSQGQVVTRDDGSIKFNITENWERVWVTWKTKEDASGLKNIIVSRLQNSSGTGKIYIAGVKLEKGNKATDWTPAPEDIEASIDNVKQQTSEVVVGTQTAATGSWTGVASLSSLKDKQQITYWLPYAGSGNATLTLTLSDGSNTGAIPCYYSGTTRLTTHYAAGNAIHLTYRENVTIGTTTIAKGWWADANYNTNDNTYDRIRYNNNIKAKTAITASTLIVGDSSGYFKLAAGSVFDIDKPILWAGSAIAAAATGTNNYLSMPSCTMRNNTNSTWVATQYETLYLVGKLEGQKFTADSATFLTTTKPTTDDDKYYISLGYMYSTYQIYLYPEHPIFKYVDGAFKNLNQVAYEAQNDYNNLEIGGRNLILNSSFEKDLNNWTTNDNKAEIVKTGYANGKGCKLTITTTSVVTPRQSRSNFYFYTGDVILVTAKIKPITEGLNLNSLIFRFVSQISLTLTKQVNIDNGWILCTFKYTFESDKDLSNVDYGFYNVSGTFIIDELKMEVGTKPTDWTPAPEDVQEEIEVNKQEIIKTNNNVSTIEQNLNSVTTRVESTEKQVSTINGEIVLTNSSHDYPIHIEDAGQYDAINCIIEGNSEQNDIPSPEFPSEIKTIGNNPNIFPVSLTTLDGTAITKTNCTAEINENEYIITATKASSLCFGTYIASGTAYQAKNGYLISVKPNTTYYLHLDNELFNQNFITELDENKISLGYTRFTTNKGSITTKPNTKYVVIRFGLVASAIDEQFKTKVDLSTVDRNRYVEYNHDNIEVKSVGKNLFNKDDYTELNGTPKVDGMNFISGGSNYCIIMECKHNARYVVQKLAGGNNNVFTLATISTVPSTASGASTPLLKIVRDDNATSLNLTTDNDDKYLIFLFYNKNESVLTKQQLLDSIQIEIKNVGENPTEYEEYKESSVICDLSKENLAVREYTNLWYSSSTKLISETTTGYSVIVKIKPNTYYTIHKPLATNRYLIASCTDEPKAGGSINTSFIGLNNSNLLDYTIRTGENDNYLIIGLGVFNDNHSVTDLYNILTCINSYCLYEGASSSENYELVKVNDTFDTYNLSTGIFTQKIGKIVLNGYESYSLVGSPYPSLFRLTLNNYLKMATTTCICDNYKAVNNVSGNSEAYNRGNYTICFRKSDNHILYIRDDRFTTVEDFKTWLNENPTTLYYILNEPDLIQTNKSNIMLYEGENNISLVDSPIEPNNMQVDYYTNSGLNNIYQNQFAEQKITNESIENRVSATEETATNLNNQYTDLKQTVDGFKFTTTSEVQEKLSNGDLKVELVKTTIVTIDNDGVSVEKDDSQMKSLLDNEGLYVNKGIIDKQGNNTLKADINGVETENLYVRTYATLGNHRFEGYIDGNGKKRTGLFYQGGAE